MRNPDELFVQVNSMEGSEVTKIHIRRDAVLTCEPIQNGHCRVTLSNGQSYRLYEPAGVIIGFVNHGTNFWGSGAEYSWLQTATTQEKRNMQIGNLEGVTRGPAADQYSGQGW